LVQIILILQRTNNWAKFSNDLVDYIWRHQKRRLQTKTDFNKSFSKGKLEKTWHCKSIAERI